MIKLFTHLDLDGISCAIVAFSKFGRDSVHVEYCGYTNINQKIEQFIFTEEYKNYSQIFITDISVNETVAELINNNVKNITLIDHHKTAKWLNKYDWAIVSEFQYIDSQYKSLSNTNSSGTSLFFLHLNNNNNVSIKLETFVEIIRLYDTWDWYSTNNHIPKRLNDLFKIIGRERFIDEMMYRITNDDPVFKPLTEFDNKIIALRQEEIDRYINSKNKHMSKHMIQGYIVGVIYAEQYISELGNKLCEMNKDVDLIAIINNCHSVSYRTIKDIDLSKFASVYGGGGHLKASSSPIKADLKQEITEMIFNIN